MTNFFFALTLPDETKTYIDNIITNLKKQLPFKKWLHPQDYHITLAFLGNTEEGMRRKAEKLVEEAIEPLGEFSLTVTDIGTFGPVHAPRILWLGVEHSNSLLELQKKTYAASEQAGFILDKKPFKPHITVARKYIGDIPYQIEKSQDLTMLQRGEHVFRASQVTLYKTHMGASPSYEPIFTVPLKKS
ncbi:RNA 2',3'-cyclic phosphodiesterase [Peribacillus sp. SCS-155]|uniref:RNA 2',3'-cyclic phosphodiesterase n=1 Tax=Peribacillus sedimenti TaxID=3115297 RepID=UPI003905A913